MAYCAFRCRFREGHRADYEPENPKLEWGLSIGTAVGVAAMLAPGLFVWDRFIDVPDDATEVEVVGQQWSWSFRLPGDDGRLGTSAIRNINPADNPLGISPGDPRSEEHTSELQSLMRISYAVFCLKKQTPHVHQTPNSYSV